MAQLSRRGFIALTAAAGAARVIPIAVQTSKGRYIVRLAYDKSVGAMRLVERWIP